MTEDDEIVEAMARAAEPEVFAPQWSWTGPGANRAAEVQQQAMDKARQKQRAALRAYQERMVVL